MKIKKLLDVQLYRYIFYAANTIFWACGWGALVVGIWLYTQKNRYSILAPTSYSSMSAAGLCVAVGAMVLIISFIGCVGNWLNSKCLLISFFCFVFLLFLIQSMIGLMGHLYKDAVRERAKVTLHHTINYTYGDTQRALSFWNTWSQMQMDLKCCGANNYTDWFFYPRWEGHRFVPDSCCDQSKFDMTVPNATVNCGKSVANHGLFYSRGCAFPFTDWLLQHLHIVGIIALLFGTIEIFVLLTSLRLLCHLHLVEKKRRHSNFRYKYSNTRTDNRQDGSLIDLEGD